MRDPGLLIQLATATAMVLLTVIMHGAGLALLSRVLRFETRAERSRHVAPLSARSLGFTLALVLGLFLLHRVEIWTYGVLYLLLQAAPDLSTAVYFSTITYAAIGYSDDYIVPAWRMVAAIEGINGLLLLGWSTALFVTVVARFGEVDRSGA